MIKVEKIHSPHGGNLWDAAAKYGLKPEEFIDFSASINPLGPSPQAIAAIQEALPMIRHYPEPTGKSLKESLAVYLDVDVSNIVLGNGSTELIYLLGRMKARRMLVVVPSFTEYGQGRQQQDVVKIPLSEQEQYQLPVQQIIAAIKEGDCLFLGNPNNPTARLFAADDLMEVYAAVCARNAVMVIDEAFMDFSGQHSVFKQMACQEENLMVLGSLTKFFALPGLRIGYAVAAQPVVESMESLLAPWRLNTLALVAGEKSLQDKDYIDRTLETIPAWRQSFARQLQEIKGLKVYPSDSNFLLLKVEKKGCSAEELQDKLGAEGLLIRVCSNFQGLSPFHFRLAVRSQEENQIMIKSLKRYLSSS
ncbi:MAG TPA: threonine-phosphate decarboxylase [Syntrophomonadaceae bacterium]|nr:threonine-phosphate decarboxylase [Syntrophomonadaceae bacterium]